MDIANALSVLPLEPEQRSSMEREILGSDNQWFAGIQVGHTPSAGECVFHYILGGGMDAFRKKHSIPFGVQPYPRLNV
jgi:hypothetical protein